jgi:DNA-binding beta-propeller fold protein YncE
MKMDRRNFLAQSALTTAVGLAFPYINFAKAKEDTILGHGQYRYKVVKDWGVLDSSTPVKDCHEMVQDSQGRLILLTNEVKNNIIIYNKSGKLLAKWGTEFPGAHGLTLSNENGEEFLYITDHDRRQIFKTTLEGQIIFKIGYPKEANVYKYDGAYYKPTEIAVAPNGDFYVADGYGEQYISRYNYKGELVQVFGGRGMENDKFTECHGITLDNRNKNNPTLLITDRQKHQFKRFSLDGKYISTIPLNNLWNCRAVIKGENIYFAALKSNDKWDSSGLGFVGIIDKNDKVVSCPGGTEPIYKNGELQTMLQSSKLFTYPHDVCIDDEESIYVAQWNSGRTYPIKLQRV